MFDTAIVYKVFPMMTSNTVLISQHVLSFPFSLKTLSDKKLFVILKESRSALHTGDVHGHGEDHWMAVHRVK